MEQNGLLVGPLLGQNLACPSLHSYGANSVNDEFMGNPLEFYKIRNPSKLIALSYDQKGAMATICSVNLCQSDIFVAAIFALNHCRFRLSEEFSY